MSSKSKNGPQKQFPGQHDGEVVELVFHQHPLVMRKALIVGLFAILAAVSPLAFYEVWTIPWLTAILLKLVIIVPLAVAAYWFWRWVGWYYTLYIVTDQRIMQIRQKGFFDRTVDEWQLDNVQNVNYRVGGFQAVIFGFGDITIRTFIGDLVIPNVHHPVQIHEQILSIVRRAGGAATGPAAGTPFTA